MLEVNKKVTINGDSKVNGTVAERYTATIDETNPDNITFTRIITDSDLRKENRKQCRKDQAAFEDDAYDVQDQMIENAGRTIEAEDEATAEEAE